MAGCFTSSDIVVCKDVINSPCYWPARGTIVNTYDSTFSAQSQPAPRCVLPLDLAGGSRFESQKGILQELYI